MTFRRALLVVHQYLGLIVGLILAFVCVTGSLLVVLENPISGYRDYPMMHVAVGARALPLATLVSNVERAFPSQRVEQILESCPSGCTYALSMSRRDGSRVDVLVDPYTGKILQASVWQNSAVGVLFAMHADLLMGERGSIVCGALGFVLAGLAATGLYLWPGWRNAGAGFRIKWSGDQWRLNFDLHKVMGVTSVAFLIVIALSAAGRIFLPVPLSHVPNSQSSAEKRIPLPLDHLVSTADAALPGPIIFIAPALTPRDSVTVRKAVPGDPDPYGFSSVTVNQYDGKVIDVFDIRKQPLISRIYTWMYPLHIGKAGGVVMRWLYFVVGLVPIALFYTGFRMWLHKLQREYANAARRATSLRGSR